MPLWNRSSSLASSGGITSRTGGATEQIYSSQSPQSTASTQPTPYQTITTQLTPIQSTSGKSFWNKIGKVASVVAPLVGIGVYAATKKRHRVPYNYYNDKRLRAILEV